MEKIPKVSGVLGGNSCEIFRNIPQKTPMKTDAFSELLQQLLINKRSI